MKSKINKKAMTYLGILCLTCLVFYYLSIRSGGLSGGSIFLIALMWMPAFAAVCTKLLYDHSIKGIGWRIKGWRQIGIAYVLPLVSCIVVYGLTWLTGMGGCQPVGIMPFLIMATLGLFGSMITAVGEETGWRGFLLTELRRTLDYGQLNWAIGIIWYVYHMPLIVFSGR